MTAGNIATFSPRRSPPAPSGRVLAAPALIAVLASALAAQPLPEKSPFAALPPGAAPAAADSRYELLGMSVVGKTTLLGISRPSDHHSYWVPLGATVADITAVSYNAKTDEAVIRANGKPLTLALHRGAVAPADSAPPAPPAPAVASAPAPAVTAAPAAVMPAMTSQEEKEMEARMLVTDLLEIGQQQRQAYEAAQREAAMKAAAADAQPPAKSKP